MIDSHCHLDAAAFAEDRAAVVARSRAVGVRMIIVPGIRPATWSALSDMVSGQSDVFGAVGVHPHAVAELTADELRTLRDPVAALVAAAKTAGAVAIGECGLDAGSGARDDQESLLRAHIQAARLAKLPLILHVVRAHDRALAILREEGIAEVGGVLHSYSGWAALVPAYAALGLAFGFAGAVTWPGARRPVAAARAVPAELLLAETDAPDQPPAPHRGQRSEPAYLPLIIAGLAAARGQSVAAVAALTTANAERVFGLGKRRETP